jgi:hypothetical protein
MYTRLAALLAAITWAAVCGGAAGAKLEVRALAPGETSPPATIEDVAWMAGHWVGEDGSEEVFSAPAGGQIMGMFRMLQDGAPVIYEFELIAESEGSIVLHLKHFNPDLSVWEERDEWTSFPLVAVEDHAVYFDGLSYQLTDEDRLEAAVNVRDGGSERILTFSYTRAE